jgi:tetraacyldisaccharide 4'-kinase
VGAARGWLEARLTRLWWRQRPSAAARLAWPLSMLYLGAWRLARCRRVPGQRSAVPVLVVGNLVVGGAGKTPTVIALVEALRARGRHPGVVSRGHGRQGDGVRRVRAGDPPCEVGDEPLLIARLTGVPVFVGRRRADAVDAVAQAHPEVDVVISDDGLQHAALRRQAELLVFDERGQGNGLLLPAGPLRQPMPAVLPPWTRVLYTAGVPSTALPGAQARRAVSRVLPLQAWQQGRTDAEQPLRSLAGRPLLAAAGMAAPAKFFAALRAAGLAPGELPLPDHHPYTTLPWPEHTPDVLVTEKDAVKLPPACEHGTRVWVVPLDFALPDALVDDLLALLPPSSAAAVHRT